MSTLPRFTVTNHAVNQYMRRHRPDLDFAAARAELETAAAGAERTTRPAYRDASYWSIASLGVDVVATPRNDAWLILTVIPKRVPRESHAERLFAAEELKRASEAVDAARESEARAKAAAEAVVGNPPKQSTAVGAPSPKQVRQEFEGARHQAAFESKAAADRRALLELECAVLRAEVRLVNEWANQQENAKGLAAALRIAVSALMRNSNPLDALDAIAKISPGLVTPAFYDRGERPDKVNKSRE